MGASTRYVLLYTGDTGKPVTRYLPNERACVKWKKENPSYADVRWHRRSGYKDRMDTWKRF